MYPNPNTSSTTVNPKFSMKVKGNARVEDNKQLVVTSLPSLQVKNFPKESANKIVLPKTGK